ncbi:YSIRK signal domain/LPXTG anchor domain surface protein [Staphylococcus coagulans]|uniref:YSIRK signal domain/LPXTG anchor domain surface protein n=4 Tax=Staphylococcus coagulans TaxID=74706 RepID=UPI00067BF963
MKKNQLGGISPNKQNKYSIRKYTVGTASLLIGSTLIFGVHAKDASAAEEVAKQTLSAEENKEESVDQSKELNDEEIPQVNEQNGDVTEEENVVEDLPEEENATEEATQEAEQPKQEEKAVEKQQSEDKAASEKPDTPTQKSTEKAPSVDENKETQATTSERKTTESASDVAPRAVTNSKEAQVPVDTEKAALATQANGLAETVKQVASLTSNEEKEAKLVDYYSKNAGVSSEAAKQVVQGMNLDYQNLDSDQLTAEMLIALANKQEKNAPKATPVSLKSRSASIAEVQPTTLSGRNVSDLIQSETKLTVNPTKTGDVVPGQSSVSLKSALSVDDNVKAGDYFVVKYSENLQVYGVNPEDKKNIGDVYDRANGEKIATAVHDINNKTVTYTFTEYVNRFNSVKMNFDYTLFFDSKNLPDSKVNVPISVTIGDKVNSINTNITYPEYTHYDKNSLGTAFTEAISHVEDTQNPGHYIQTIYVNPLNENLKNVNLKVYVDHQKFPENIGQINADKTEIKIYQVPKGYTLNKGYYIEPSKLIDVSKNYSPIYGSNDQVSIDFKDIESPYIVVVNTKFKPTSSENPTLVQMAQLSSTNNRTIQTGNGLGFTNNSSGGASLGEKVYKVGNYVWEDKNKDGIQNETGAGISGVKVTLIDKETKQTIQTKKTNENGSYLFENVKNGNYIIKFEKPDGYEPTLKDQGKDDEKDSDGTEVEVTVNNSDNLTIDSGFYKPVYKLGDKVWNDLNKDGIQDDNEPGIANVKVTLKNKEGQELKVTQTNEEGKYEFTDLPNGEYQVDFETPDDYVPTKPNTVDDTRDSDGPSNAIGVIKDKDNLTVDQGFYKKEETKYHVGDKVWEDSNKDGIQQDTESGISGVKVTLKDKDGKVVETKTTDEKGNYLFENVSKGEYTIEFETPQGYKPTVTGKGELDKDSNGTSAEITVTQNDLTIDSGFYKPTYSLGDKVWEDTNKNGIQDKDEKGVQGVLINVFNSKNQLVDTVTTNEKGEYSVPNLPNGDYKVEFKNIPAGYVVSPTEQGNDISVDSNGLSSVITIKDQDNLTADLGIYQPTFKVGDKVWEDTNKDGIQGESESGISGVKVTLKDKDGKVVETKTTDEKGNYLFENVAKGDYTIEFETPEGYKPTVTGKGDADKDSNGTSAKVTVDKDDLTIDSGFYKPTYSLGDKVWEDRNKNGIQDEDEKGIKGVKVTLKDSTGEELDTTVTNDKGEYEFKDLPNGEYQVDFETPEGYVPTVANTEDDTKDSDGPLNAKGVIKDEDNLTVDQGFYKKEEPPVQKPATYKVGDKVWHDTNKDGIQNVNEPGISGVTVTLKQPDGTLITTKTDKDGNYIFKDLPNGKYEISFETPEGYEATTEKAGDDRRLDSDGKTVTVEVNNADDLTIDSGFYKKEEPPVQKPATYKVGDKVWHDTNKDGIQNVNEPGISGVTVTLKQPDGTLISTKTDKEGNYIFKDLPNGKYEISFETPEGYEATTANVGDDALDSDGTKVEVEVNNADDLTIDSGFYKPVVEPPKTDATYKVGDKVWHDTNKDGIQNVNEPGISGVTVTLKQPDGTLITTKTDKDGNYIFTDLPNGKYEISFETPEGYEATTANVGDDALDSDGTKVEVEVNNADDLTIDSGFYKPVVEPPKTDATYKVGDKVWNDTNKDGIQNANEAGIEGVKVTLTKADGTTVETRTDKDGNYIFTDLPNGKYEISFETPEGYEATTANVGDDALDSDGTKVEVEVNNADDLTIDSGFYKPVVEPPKTDATYKVGDKVWNDTNKDGIQNANEAGIEGVKVTLTKADGTTVETRTDKDGNYIFTDLPNGKYEISFETPEGYEATTANVGDDALDSDGTKVEVEVNNADDLTIDSGFYKLTPEVPAPEVPAPEVPEQPGNPEVPTPEVPEQPGNPEVPTPEVPEQPGNPEVPAPEVPEQPGNPEVPTPEVPEQPGNPETPTPEVPEQPGNPETPTPEVPEQPGNPETPTPEVPEQPGNPEVPTPEVPKQPGNPETPAPNMPEQPGQPKVEKAMPSTPQKAESKHKKETLPETGQENAGQTTLLGSLFAALGGAFLLGRRRKDKKEQ